MRTMVISHAASNIRYDSDLLRDKRRWYIRLLISAVAGTLIGITGLALAGASLPRVISPYGRLSILGAVLLVITFPLLIFQAHCLDKIEDVNRASRKVHYKRNLFNEGDPQSRAREFDREA